MAIDRQNAMDLVITLYQRLLERQPSESEQEGWVNALLQGMTAEKILISFLNSEEFTDKRKVQTTFPAGHYHSPVVNPADVKSYVAKARTMHAGELHGIHADANAMRKIWQSHLPFIKTTPFADHRSEGLRYFYQGGPFPYGDAITLRVMIEKYKPARIIEIGSGFSTACMLDTIVEVGLTDCKITCIEPYPDRLKSLLRPADWHTVSLIEKPVQDINPAMVSSLQPGDILFIDSTHVLKTGSDVHFELFELLPRLAPGVVIHFHDVPFPFEYPDKWIFELNYSWNEAYALRALLMDSTAYNVIFWGSLLASEYNKEIQEEFPLFLRNPGTSIWLERQ